MKTAAALVAGLVTASAGCSDVAGPPGAAIILSGSANVTDTVHALVPQPIHMQVHDADGKPAAGASVGLYDVRDITGKPISAGPKVFVTSGQLYVTLDDALASYPYDSESVVTDDMGRASVYLRLGRAAGDVYVKAVHGEYRDSVPFHTLPGAAVALAAVPADTAVLPGDSYPLTVFAVDRWGNPRPGVEPGVTAISARPPIVETNGTTVSAQSIGRTAIDLTSPTGSGRVHVSVVPDAVMAMTAWDRAALADTAAVLMAAHGITAEPIAGTDGGDSCAAWHPGGDRLLFRGLLIVAPGGEQTQVSTGNPDLIAGCGRFSVNGEWIYFNGRLQTESPRASQIWRVRTDGTGLERITAPAGGAVARDASPAPDGQRILYVVHDTTDTSHRKLVVHHLGAATTDTLRTATGLDASWSPSGEWIAYTFTSPALIHMLQFRTAIYGEVLRLVRPDGSDERWLVPSRYTSYGHGFLGPVNWSPDGEWLIGKSFYPDLRIKLVNVATGEALPLNGVTRMYSQPAWKP